MSEAAKGLSKSYRTCAGLLWDAALEAQGRGEISAFDLRRIEVEIYNPLLAHALDVVVKQALDRHAGIDALVLQVKAATRELEQGLACAQRIGAVATFGLGLVNAAARVVAFVAVPSPATAVAAVKAIGGAAAALA
jgi:hypothetical protein